MGGLNVDAVTLHLAPESDGADFQRFCRLAAIAAKTLECALDHLAFPHLQIERIASRSLTTLLRNLGRQFTHANTGAARDDDGTLDRVLELADVTRPIVVHQRGHGFW